MREARFRLAGCALLVLALGVNASGTVLTLTRRWVTVCSCRFDCDSFNPGIPWL